MRAQPLRRVMMGTALGPMVLPDRIELSTSPLPRECSTTELRQQTGRRGNRPSRAATKRGRFLPQGLPRCKRGGRVSGPRMGRRRTKSVSILAIMHKCLGPGLIQAGGRPVARRIGGLPACRNLPIRAGDAGRGGTYLCRRLRAWSLLGACSALPWLLTAWPQLCLETT